MSEPNDVYVDYAKMKAERDALAAQRDEGLAREAELREELRQMTVARDRWQFDYKNEQDASGRLIDRCDHLTKRLAEAENYACSNCNGTKRVHVDKGWTLPCSVCADGEKAE